MSDDKAKLLRWLPGASDEAVSVVLGMVEHGLNVRACMGMDEGFKSFEPEEEHDFVKELRALLAQPSYGALTNEGAEPVYQVRSHGSCCWEDISGESLELCSANPEEYEVRTLWPSGDGSLRWPCPVHPPEPTAVAWECDDSTGETGRVLVTNDPAVRDEWVRQELPVCPLFGPASTESRS